MAVPPEQERNVQLELFTELVEEASTINSEQPYPHEPGTLIRISEATALYANEGAQAAIDWLQREIALASI